MKLKQELGEEAACPWGGVELLSHEARPALQAWVLGRWRAAAVLSRQMEEPVSPLLLSHSLLLIHWLRTEHREVSEQLRLRVFKFP